MDTRKNQKAVIEHALEEKNNLMRQLTLNPNIETQEKNKKIVRLMCEINDHRMQLLKLRLAEVDEREREVLGSYHQQYPSR